MFANDKNIDNLQQLFVELKKYGQEPAFPVVI